MSPNHDDAVKQSTLSTCYDVTAKVWKASPIEVIDLKYLWLLRLRLMFHTVSAAVSRIQIERPEAFLDSYLSSGHPRTNQRRLSIADQT
jgi:hypothetical protein